MSSSDNTLASPARLEALRRLNLMDTAAEPVFDRLTRMTARVVGAPVCLVSLVDDRRQFFKSAIGLGGWAGEQRGTPLTHSFCQHVVTSGAPLVVEDARNHAVVCDNLAIRDLGVQAYLGIPIHAPDGAVLGSFCVIDVTPRTWTPGEVETVSEFASLVESEIVLRSESIRLEGALSRYEAVLDSTTLSMIATTPEGIITVFNAGAERMLGYSAAEMVERQTPSIIHDGAEVEARAAELSVQLGMPIQAGFNTFTVLARQGRPDERAWTYVRKDGSRLPVILTVSAHFDAQGQVAGFLGIARDDTERQRAKVALDNAAEMLRQTGELAKVGGWELDLATMKPVWTVETGRIHEVDPPVAPPLDQAINFYTPEARPVIAAAVQRAIAGGTGWDLELPVITAKGRPIWVRTQGRVIQRDGVAVKLVGAFQDITERKTARLEMEETAERFRKLGRQVPGLIYQFRLRPDGTSCFPYASEGIRDIYRVSAEEAREDGAAAFALMHPDDVAMVHEAKRQSAETLTPLQFEYRLRHADGTVRWLLGNSMPERESDGSVLWHGFATDITERKEIDEQLRLQTERISLAADLAELGVWDWDLASNKINWDERMHRIYGLEPRVKAAVAYDTWAAAVWPEDLAEQVAILQETARVGGRSQREFRIRHAGDGAVRYVQAIEKAVVDTSGRVTRVVGVNRDITGIKIAEAALRESEDRFRRAFEDAGIGMALVGLDGRWLRVNRALSESVGYSPEELLQKTFQDITHPDDLARDLAHVKALLAGEVPRYQMEKRYFHRDGHVVWVNLTGSLVRDAAGAPLNFVAQIEDITLRKQLEDNLAKARDQALESSRLKSEFLATMSHEIRTPMNGVLGMAGLLMTTPLSEEQRQMGEVIEQSAESLLTVINDILDFSRIEAGKLRIEPAEFDLRRVVNEAAALLAPRAHEKGLELICAYPPRPGERFIGDAGRVRQVLVNLLGNAVKFTDAGEVQIAMIMRRETASEAVVRIEVRDTGVGIAPEAHRLLFQPFVQVDGSASRRFGGTGLGLAISRQLVELMGGTIDFSSVAGKGSTFWIELPVRRGGTRSADEPIVVPSGRRVLLVEDNATNRQLLQQQLARCGLMVEVAAGGQAALDRLRAPGATACELVILDSEMPGMNGLNLAKAIRADRAWSGLPLVMLSSAAPTRKPGEETALGFAAILTKPVREEQLHRCLARILGATVASRVTATSQEAAGEGKPLHAGLRLLLAEDNPANQLVAKIFLGRLGHTVEVAENGELALARLATEHFDAVLMDCQMPLLDGYEVTRRIRAGMVPGLDATIPIIALTAYARAEDRAKCMDAGMNDYVSKPLRPESLAEALRRQFPVKPVPVADEVRVETGDRPTIIDLKAFAAARSLPGVRGRSLLPELVAIYAGEEPQRLAEIARCREQRLAIPLAEAAHALGGNAASFGGAAVRQAALGLEEAARAANWLLVETRHRELLDACLSLRAELAARKVNEP